MSAPQEPDPNVELLLEAATTAHRPRDAYGRILPAPAWADLPPARRRDLFDRQLAARLIERAIDPAGRSSTAHAVLGRIHLLPQFQEDEE